MEFMQRYIRERAVAPLDPTLPGLPTQERRAWWEFCTEMAQFLANVLSNIRTRKRPSLRFHQLAWLQWICIRGGYVFASADPALRAEQSRYAEVCRCIDGIFAAIMNDSAGLKDMAGRVARPERLNPVALANILCSREWAEAGKPLETLIEGAMYQGVVLREIMFSNCGAGLGQSFPTSEDWQLAAFENDSHVNIDPLEFPDQLVPRRDHRIAAVTACLDMEAAFDAADLSIDARRVAYAKMEGITREEAPAELGISKQEVGAAWRELGRKGKMVKEALRSTKI